MAWLNSGIDEKGETVMSEAQYGKPDAGTLLAACETDGLTYVQEPQPVFVELREGVWVNTTALLMITDLNHNCEIRVSCSRDIQCTDKTLKELWETATCRPQ